VSPRARAVVTGFAAATLFAVLLAGFAHLPDFGVYLGPYGTMLNAVAPSERKIPNIITAVNFDYRGLDTMGEEFILFASVAGLALVLRNDRAKTTERPLPAAPGRGAGVRTDALSAFSVAGIALTVAFGWYMAMHPHLTPGGGFQGGAITAGIVTLVLFGLGYRALGRFAARDRVEPFEAIGAAGYVVIGVATLAMTGAFLANALPLGSAGAFFSTGTIPLINAFVALEVVAGFAVMFLEFADETRVELSRGEKDAVP